MHHQEALVLNRTNECLEENIFPREDCLEFIELTVAYLGEEIPNGRIFRFRKPRNLPKTVVSLTGPFVGSG